MDKAITDFLEKQTLLSLATCAGGIPYSAACFYAFSAEENELIFKSSPHSRHVSEGLANNSVAGTINPDSLKTGRVQGVQFSGTFIQPSGNRLAAAERKYHARYPFARVVAGAFFIIRLNDVKMTDHRLGFGKKVLWKRNQTAVT
jgi:uncharacterized protein